MQVGTYSDGRPLNYDETANVFDVGGSPVTLADVVGYDQAGQVDWLTDDLKAWGQGLASGLSTEGQNPVTVTKPRGLFGFRSRRWWKMVIASLYYAFCGLAALSVVGSVKPYSTAPIDIVLDVASYLIVVLALLSPAFLLSDFGYRDRLPLFKRRKLLWSAVGLAVVCLLMGVTIAFAGTLHTQPYKVAAEKERVALLKKQEAEAAAKRAAEERATAEAKRLADAKEAREASATAEAKRLADEKEAAEASATVEAQRLADAKKAADASATAEAKRLADEKKAAAQPAQPAVAPTTYVFQIPSSFAKGSPERVVAEYTSAWKAKDWVKMAGSADFESRNRESDLAGQLRAQHDFKVLKGFEIQKATRVSDVAADVTYAIWYDSEFSGMEAKVVKAKVLKMTSDGNLSAGGAWGVNPISALRENDY